MDETMNETVRTPPFAPFEWLLSGRYLRARRKEGFISVIAGFSFLGIMLGVATLIIVMAVDERLSQGTAGQDPRAQRASAGAAAGIAADRLEGRRRAHQPGAGHPAGGAGRGRSGAGVLGLQRRRRAGARHALRGSEQPHLDRQEHQAGHAGRF